MALKPSSRRRSPAPSIPTAAQRPVGIGHGTFHEGQELAEPQARQRGIDGTLGMADGQERPPRLLPVGEIEAGGTGVVDREPGPGRRIGLGGEGAGERQPSLAVGKIRLAQAVLPQEAALEAVPEPLPARTQGELRPEIGRDRQNPCERPRGLGHLLAAAIDGEAAQKLLHAQETADERRPQEQQQPVGGGAEIPRRVGEPGRQAVAPQRGPAGRTGAARPLERQRRLHAAALGQLAPEHPALPAGLALQELGLPQGIVGILQRLVPPGRAPCQQGLQVLGEQRQRVPVQAAERAGQEQAVGAAGTAQMGRVQQRPAVLPEVRTRGLQQDGHVLVPLQRLEGDLRLRPHRLQRQPQAGDAHVARAQDLVPGGERQHRLAHPVRPAAGRQVEQDAGQEGPPRLPLAAEQERLLGREREGLGRDRRLAHDHAHAAASPSRARSAPRWRIAIAVRTLRLPVKALRAWTVRMLSSSTTSPLAQANSTITAR